MQKFICFFLLSLMAIQFGYAKKPITHKTKLQIEIKQLQDSLEVVLNKNKVEIINGCDSAIKQSDNNLAIVVINDNIVIDSLSVTNQCLRDSITHRNNVCLSQKVTLSDNYYRIEGLKSELNRSETDKTVWASLTMAIICYEVFRHLIVR